MALPLQEGGIGRSDGPVWIGDILGFRDMSDSDRGAIIQHMVDNHILADEQGILSMGKAGEAAFGCRHFMELFSVFTSPPVFTVFHGRSEVGQVHAPSFKGTGGQPAILTLRGRDWRVTHIDWNRRSAFAQPSDERGRSRWLGGNQAFGFEMAQAELEVLVGVECPDWLSRRGCVALEEARAAHEGVHTEATVVVTGSDSRRRWWTLRRRSGQCCVGQGIGRGGVDSTTLDQPADLAEGDALPPLWHWIYFFPAVPMSELGRDGHPRLGDFIPPVDLPRRMWAGGRFEFTRPLTLGESPRWSARGRQWPAPALASARGGPRCRWRHPCVKA